MMADRIAKVAQAVEFDFIFKPSVDKANRSSVSTTRCIGIDVGLKILQDVKAEFGCPTLTDVHEAQQCAAVAQAVDVLQIPAFLCRQMDLLLAAGNTDAVGYGACGNQNRHHGQRAHLVM